ncbi:MAG: hypothetical protein KC777_11460, partial [Cyanobacteria bacterium HKST-UBA02]|nr:hypothetical protein [Cyanobacteria bacterium HKST-UBA02]
MTLKLYLKDVLVVTITHITTFDTFEKSSRIALTPAAEKFKPVFSNLTDEKSLTSGAPLPFDESFLDEWFLVDENCARKEIGGPGIYE